MSLWLVELVERIRRFGLHGTHEKSTIESEIPLRVLRDDSSILMRVSVDKCKLHSNFTLIPSRS